MPTLLDKREPELCKDEDDLAARALDWVDPPPRPRDFSVARARYGQHVIDLLGTHLPWERIGRSALEGFKASPGMVYFVGADTGPVKIGFSVRPLCRLAAMQLGSPVIIRILAGVIAPVSVEAEYHRRFASARRHGEWFARVPEIEAEIARLSQVEAS